VTGASTLSGPPRRASCGSSPAPAALPPAGALPLSAVSEKTARRVALPAGALAARLRSIVPKKRKPALLRAPHHCPASAYWDMPWGRASAEARRSSRHAQALGAPEDMVDSAAAGLSVLCGRDS